MIVWIVIWFASMPLDATTNLCCNRSGHFHYLKEAFQLHQVLAPLKILSFTDFTLSVQTICVTACPLFLSNIICPVKGYEHHNIFFTEVLNNSSMKYCIFICSMSTFYINFFFM